MTAVVGQAMSLRDANGEESMRKPRKLGWRSRKVIDVERRFFETIFVGWLQEMTADDELPPRSLEKVARCYSPASEESRCRAD